VPGRIPELARFIPPARAFDKYVYSPLTGSDLHQQLRSAVHPCSCPNKKAACHGGRPLFHDLPRFWRAHHRRSLRDLASIAWTADGWVESKASRVVQNVILFLINALGVWRWFPRAEKEAKS
jgi:hypothetical protein